MSHKTALARRRDRDGLGVMSVNRPAAGGGREILVAARRFGKWIDGFDTRHRITAAQITARGMTVTAADDAVAECALPLWGGAPQALPDGDARDTIEHFDEAAGRGWRVGAVLARRRGVAVGIFQGDDLVQSKVDSSYVQSRTAAGGWSQQRYARRRGNQAGKAADKAADIVNRILVADVSRLDAIVTAGDKQAVAAILSDSRLQVLSDRLVAPHIGDVGEPKLVTLKELPKRFWTVRILLVEPAEADSTT